MILQFKLFNSLDMPCVKKNLGDKFKNNKKSTIISICEIHIYIDSESFRLFGDCHLDKMRYWDVVIIVFLEVFMG